MTTMAKKIEDKAPDTTTDLAAEFAELGRAMRDALDAAWGSQERRHLEQEIRSGLQQFADEMEAAAKNIRESSPGQRAEGKMRQVRDDVQSGTVAEDARQGVAQALRAVRDAIDRMADSFTTIEEVEEKKVEFDPIDMDRDKKK